MTSFMDDALVEASIALSKNEIPIGCVIVHNNQIIGRGHNTREFTNDITGHAEINAIKDAANNIGSWKLDGCVMYITVEPCLMCYGAILQSRIKKVVVGSRQDEIKKSSYLKYINDDKIIEYEINKEAIQLMKNFFAKRR